jgi:hypothetical protein
MEENNFLDKSNGYMYIYKPKHPNSKQNGCILLHRYLMSEYIKRPLKSQEYVDHIDGNKLNNDIKNLQILTPLKHNQKHRGIRKKVKCNICKKITINKKYCCWKCNCIGQRKCKRPSKKQLINLLKNNYFTEVAKMFGVTDNAIRKWIK